MARCWQTRFSRPRATNVFESRVAISSRRAIHVAAMLFRTPGHDTEPAPY